MCHLEYFKWPDYEEVIDLNKKEHMLNLLNMLAFLDHCSLTHDQLVNEYNMKRSLIYKNMLGHIRERTEFPMCVHCATGCDESATFCALKVCVSYCNQNKGHHNLKVSTVVKKIRETHPNAISTFEQYLLIYRVLYFKAKLDFYHQSLRTNKFGTKK